MKLKKLKWIMTLVVVLPIAVVVAGVAILSSLDFEEYRGLAEREVEAATGRDLKIAGAIDLKFFPTFAVSLRDVDFANADWGSPEPMVRLKSVDVEVEVLALLGGVVKIKQLVLVNPQILLETDATGRGNWQIEGAATDDGSAAEPTAAQSGSPGEGLVLPQYDRLVLRGGLLTYRDGASGRELRLAIEELSGRSEDASDALTVAMTGSYNDAPVALDARIEALANLAAGEAFPLQINAKGGGAEFSLEGRIGGLPEAPALDLQVTVAGRSLADLAPFAGAAVPPLGPYSLSMHVGRDGDTYVLSALAIKMGSSDLTGSLRLSLAGERPRIEANLAAQLIDLKDFSAKTLRDGTNEASEAKEAGQPSQPDSKAAPAGSPSSDYVFGEEPLPLDGLRALDAEIELVAKRVKLQDKLAMQEVATHITLADGRLRIDPATSGFGGGKVQLAVDLDAAMATPSLKLQLNAAKVNYGQLLKDLALEDSVSGEVDIDIDLAGTGRTPRAIASSLDGHSQIVSQDGTINNRLLKLISVGLGDILGPIMGVDRDARLECVVSRFDIADGRARSRTLVLDSEAVSLIGEGGIDLRGEVLDLRFDTQTSDSSIASLAVPFKVRGSLKKPQVVPDAAALATGVAETVGALTGDASGALGSILGGGASGDGGTAPPCAVALHAVGLGPAPAAAEPATSDTQSKGSIEDAAKQIEDAAEGLVKGLKGLLGSD